MGARAGRRLVRPGDVPGRLGTLHDDRRRRQPLGRRRGGGRGQPEVHLGGDLGDPGGAHRRGVRPRPAGTPRRPSGHQSGAARRRSRAATASGPAGRHSRAARRGGNRPDIAGKTVLAAMAQIPGVDWSVIVKQPLAEAFAPIYAALWRTVALLVAGAALAAVLAWWLAQRMIGPDPTAGGWRRRGSAQDSSTTASSLRPATNSSGWRRASTRWRRNCRSRRSARNASAG